MGHPFLGVIDTGKVQGGHTGVAPQSYGNYPADAVPQGNIAYFDDPPPPPRGQYKGQPKALYTGPVPWIKKYIPPIDIAASYRFAQILSFVRPMPAGMNPDSNPRLRAQYNFGPPPIGVTGISAGELNLQLQLGNIAIQGAQLTQDASNFFGG